jgi:glycosyltransferase involved in cell wall biosynthesis
MATKQQNQSATVISKKKILLVGDYSNCHRTLRDALRRLGHDVTLISNGSGFQDTERDIDMSRAEGKLAGATYFLKWRYRMKHVMTGNDVVVLQNPHFMTQRPSRLKIMFDFLKRENGKIFLTAAGTDCAYIKSCLTSDYPLRYNDFVIDGKPSPYAVASPEYIRDWTTPTMQAYNDHIYNNVDGIATILYEYDVAVRHYLKGSGPKVEYCGIPIDTGRLQPVPDPGVPETVKLFLGRHRGRYAEKGTDLLEQAAKTVVARHPGRCSLEIIEDRPYAEYVNLQRSSHLILDQIYSYTPATNAMIAMAQCLNVVSGGEPEFYDFIGERENRPVINAPVTLDALTEVLDDAVCHPELIAERGRRSREFVIKHNDADLVARRFLKLWFGE